MGREHGWRWTAFVNGFWKAFGWAVVLLIVAFILLAHSSSTPVHTTAWEQQQARRLQEDRALAFQEEERQAPSH